jgi:hypothetical protein
VEDYLPLHQWFDQSKAIFADPRHRALRHHAEGIFMLETLFGPTIVNADSRVVPVRLIGEQHVREDLGSIPSFADWARLIAPQAWMLRGHHLDDPLGRAGGESDLGSEPPVFRSSFCCGKVGQGRNLTVGLPGR